MLRREERRTTRPCRPGGPGQYPDATIFPGTADLREYEDVVAGGISEIVAGLPISVPIRPVVGPEEVDAWLRLDQISPGNPLPVSANTASTSSQSCGGIQITYEDVVYQHETWHRNALGQVIEYVDGDGIKTAFEYDDSARLKKVISPGGLETEYRYNNHGEQWRILGEAGAVTELRYGDSGLLSKVIAPNGAETVYRHDGFGDLRQQISADTGLTEYDYWPSANVQEMMRSDGQREAYQYDEMGRLTLHSVGAKNHSYEYDNCSNGIGKLCATNSDARIEYQYTLDGQVAQKTTRIGDASFSSAYGYDTVGRLTSVTYPTGNEVHYEYSGPGSRLAKVEAVVGNTVYTVAEQFSYYPFGPRSSMLFGNSVRLSATRNQAYRLTEKFAYALQDLSFNYNARGELTEVADGLSSRRSQSYAYDDLGRLVSVASGLGNRTWTLDANGNRLSHSASNTDAYHYSGSVSNQLDSITGARAREFEYGSLGNLTGQTGWGGERVFGYDAMNRLESVSSPLGSATYAYDASNLRVEKSTGAGAVRFAYDSAGALLAETALGAEGFNQAGHTQYVWVEGEVIAIIRGGQIYFVLSDHLTRPERVLNAAQATVWEAENVPFDRAVTSELFGPLNLGYPGQYYDGESGLWYNWHRYYDPSLGRYITSDPIGLAGGLNTYAYVGGNPISNFDPYGLWSVSFGVYTGFGGSIVVGQSPTTGQWFFGGRLGVGLGGGASFDLNGDRPGGSTDPSKCDSGTSVGTFINAGAAVGPYQYDPINAQGGYNYGAGDYYSQGPVGSGLTFGNGGVGIEFGGAFGVEAVGSW